MLRGANIICLSAIDWTFNWQVQQELASAFVETGNRVLFIENTGVRRAALRDVRRMWTRFINWSGTRGGVRTVDNGVEVHSPLLVPTPYCPSAVAINTRLLLRVIRRWLSAQSSGPLVLLTFLPTPLAVEIARRLRPDFVIYYSTDRLAESSRSASGLRESEPKMIAAADLILLTAENLRSHSMCDARVELFPSCVRFRDFQNAGNDGVRPSIFKGLKRPIVGFTGSLRNQTDIALIARTAAAAAEMTFLFIGPVQTNVRRLAELPNVRFVAPIPHDELIRILPHFDAGILPYVLDDFTSGIMPAKLSEYLAAGLPVVSTPLPEVCRFAQQHPGMIQFASDAPSFIAAVRDAVRNNAPAALQRRIDVARQYDFSERMARMSDLVEELIRAGS